MTENLISDTRPPMWGYAPTTAAATGPQASFARADREIGADGWMVGTVTDQ